ncbi:semaphorin-6D-like isoform X2 [Hemiscyllium ocellatum]|uniref:semaphorin-6D-like isoform X2 n=1 Tax=Hemiscyllium ocellatum TaxID=170820 RepID=UPI00296714A6|nr:semaphorin-6D-like isoform X2 [Hemiscyllium ocellatum]
MAMPTILWGVAPPHKASGFTLGLLIAGLLLSLGPQTVGASAFPRDAAPLNVVTAEDAQEYPTFRGLVSDNGSASPGLDFQRMLRINQTLYISARDHIYSFDLGRSPQDILNPRNKVQWRTKGSDMQNCAMRGKHRDECHNFIRVLVPRSDRTLFACGTNAFNPICRNYKMESLLQESEEVNGQARCPFDTRQTNVALFADGNLYSATMADFLASDAVIYRSLGPAPVLRTVKYDSKWLKEPHFVHTIEYGPYVYFFFREIAIEYTALGKVVFSRVGRVCKNDRGGSPRVLEKYWTSFLKARLNCSISGQSYFYFDVLQSLSNVVTINGRPTVIGVFTTQSNSIPGSAVCGFHMEDIDRVFDGAFKEQRSTDSGWTPVPDERVPTPRPGVCAGHGGAQSYKSSNDIPDESLSFIKSHPLMDAAPPPVAERPWLVRSVGRSRLTAIAVDPSAGPHGNHTVLFVGADDGVLLKVLAQTRPGASIEGLLLERMDVYPRGRCGAKADDRRILGLELDKDHHSVFVAFPGCVAQVPLSRCEGYGKCKRGGYQQDVENGKIQHLERCEDPTPSIRNSFQDPSNGVRKEPTSNSQGTVHLNFLIACTVSAFALGALLSGLAFSWYCGRWGQGPGKAPEGAGVTGTVSLPSLAKLLEAQLAEGRGLDTSARPHPYAGLLAPPVPEPGALPTPDATPELPPKSHRPFRGRWVQAAANPAPSYPGGPQPFRVPSAVVLPNNALGRNRTPPSPSEGGGGEEKAKAWGLEPAEAPQKAVDIGALDELLRRLQEMNAHSRAALSRPHPPPRGRPLPPAPPRGPAAYLSSATLPRPSVPPGLGPTQRHSLSTTFPKASPPAPGLAKHHSFGHRSRAKPSTATPPGGDDDDDDDDQASPSRHAPPPRRGCQPGDTLPRRQRGSGGEFRPVTPPTRAQSPSGGSSSSSSDQ